MENKILNIKLKENDLKDIEMIITNNIIKLQNETADDINAQNYEIYKYKQLLIKLQVASWYNE